jgi:geranylgeranyl pyrophosphate synthase
MKVFERKFRESMKSSVPLLEKITYYIVKRKGKQIRPMFVFLSAGICGGIHESTYRAASMIELLHTATLVHDDVVDDSNERRGFFSVNALWKNKIAVFVKNVEYLKIKHSMSDYKIGDFICSQTGISIYKTTAIGFLVNRKRMSTEKLFFHAKAVGISFDIDPLDLISSDIEYSDAGNFTKKFWK